MFSGSRYVRGHSKMIWPYVKSVSAKFMKESIDLECDMDSSNTFGQAGILEF
jgi:hypothetical protein